MSINQNLINYCKLPILGEIVNSIVSIVDPDKIILFGSYARGDNHEKSDVDLLVIKKGLTKERDTSKLIERTLYKQNIFTATDILTVDPEKYQKNINVLGNIYKTINLEGKVIYERL